MLRESSNFAIDKMPEMDYLYSNQINWQQGWVRRAMTPSLETPAVNLVLPLAFAFAARGRRSHAVISGNAPDSTGPLLRDALRVATGLSFRPGFKPCAPTRTEVCQQAQLREGTSGLRASNARSKGFLTRGIHLAGRDCLRMDGQPEPGSGETAIQVRVGSALLETEIARISGSRDAARRRETLLDSRAISTQSWPVLTELQASAGSTFRFSPASLPQCLPTRSIPDQNLTSGAWFGERGFKGEIP